VPFPYNENAPKPELWLQFLGESWPDDPESIAALQKFFGYVTSGRTDHHKIMLLVGPTRAGKGVIARVLKGLVGEGNHAGPSLASLATNFGLAPLIGKPLAIISDARLDDRRSTATVVERLLSVSDEDMLTIERKYRDAWTGTLPTRFMVISNELPNLGDASGAIAARMIVLTLSRSWLGNENTRLLSELYEELPGILNWALEGLERLQAEECFTEPESSRDAIVALQDLSTAAPMCAVTVIWQWPRTPRRPPTPTRRRCWSSWHARSGPSSRSGRSSERGRRAAVKIPPVGFPPRGPMERLGS
jgi:putative DNA primase/helicase